MEMTIEDIILELERAKEYSISNEAVNYALDTIHKYLLMQSDYENRLKADLVAMLEELKSEANELEDPKYILETSELPLDVDGTTLSLETYALRCYCRGGDDVIDIIEKKINSIKESKNV